MELNRPPQVLWVYVDEYVEVTADLEVLTSEIIKDIKGNPRLHDWYFYQLMQRPSIQEKLEFAREFWRDLEIHRRWVDTHL